MSYYNRIATLMSIAFLFGMFVEAQPGSRVNGPFYIAAAIVAILVLIIERPWQHRHGA